jgi:hypothetical protein|tara:strand:- start:285 stop:428 length:144 start_codon:yes stop_codon:yes gene_type:complete
MKITFEGTIGANRDDAWSAYTTPHDRVSFKFIIVQSEERGGYEILTK